MQCFCSEHSENIIHIAGDIMKAHELCDEILLTGLKMDKAKIGYGWASYKSDKNSIFSYVYCSSLIFVEDHLIIVCLCIR